MRSCCVQAASNPVDAPKPAPDPLAKPPSAAAGARRKATHGSSPAAPSSRKGAGGGLPVRRLSVGSRLKARVDRARSLKDMSLLAGAAGGEYAPGDKVAVEVIHTATTVDVMWQVR